MFVFHYLIIVLFLLYSCNEDPKTEIQVINCQVNTDCQEGQICSDQKCVSKNCNFNTDCETGFLCIESQCVLVFDCRNEECPCSSNADCVDAERCDENQKCVVRECLEDIDCPIGAVCLDGICKVDVNADRDEDGLPDGSDHENLMRDNCPSIANSDQEDLDMDQIGDACDDDLDGDTVLNANDNCVRFANMNQSNIDLDALGDACDDDIDGDTILNMNDNCENIQNRAQRDIDSDGIGDECEPEFLRVCGNCPISYIDQEGSFFCGGTCDANQERCMTGSSRCKNAIRQICSEDNTWSNQPCREAQDNTPGEFCEIDENLQAICRDQVCIPLQKSCRISEQESYLIECNTIGSASVIINTCPAGSVCQKSSEQEYFCANQQCKANEEFCSTNQILKCNSDGTSSVLSPRQCETGFVCASKTANDIEVPCIKACGNGIVNSDQGEECDDGNQNDQDNCTNQCKIASCGDGIKWTDVEECDQGIQNNNMADSCRRNCKLPKCGDGIIDILNREECDDANAVSTDNCLSDCKLPFCGDGIKSSVEECDDGDLNDANSCSNRCLLARCGDGRLNSDEECDDGNQNNNDSCSNSCKSSVCGDGIVRESFELCDQGSLNSNTIPDRCRLDCSLPRCGDHIVDSREECDDGNLIPGDGCGSTCIASKCGDGIKEGSEECDDGNQTDTDECSSSCKRAKCGDGFIRANSIEECDDGNSFNDDNCLNTCKIAVCGDGLINFASAEECDDGNDNNQDECINSCKNAKCGDGFVRDGLEICDDGNSISIDNCSNSCKKPSGKVQCGSSEPILDVKGLYGFYSDTYGNLHTYCFLQQDHDIICQKMTTSFTITSFNPFPNLKFQDIELFAYTPPFSNVASTIVCGVTKTNSSLNVEVSPGEKEPFDVGHLLCKDLSNNSEFQIKTSLTLVPNTSFYSAELITQLPPYDFNEQPNISEISSNGLDLCVVSVVPYDLNSDMINTSVLCYSGNNIFNSMGVYALMSPTKDLKVLSRELGVLCQKNLSSYGYNRDHYACTKDLYQIFGLTNYNNPFLQYAVVDEYNNFVIDFSGATAGKGGSINLDFGLDMSQVQLLSYQNYHQDYFIQNRLYLSDGLIEVSPSLKKFIKEKGAIGNEIKALLLNDGRLISSNQSSFGSLFNYDEKYTNLEPLINEGGDIFVGGYYPVYPFSSFKTTYYNEIGPFTRVNRNCLKDQNNVLRCLDFSWGHLDDFVDFSTLNAQTNNEELIDFSESNQTRCVITKNPVNGKTWFCEYTGTDDYHDINSPNHKLVAFFERLDQLQTIDNKVFKKFVVFKPVVPVANGDICAIATDNKFYCLDSEHNTSINTNNQFTHIESNGVIDCGITSLSRVTCWYSYLLGYNADLNSYYPLFNVPVGSYKKIQLGAYDVCTLSNAGRIACYGRNANVLSQINTANNNIDFQMVDFPGNLCWISVVE